MLDSLQQRIAGLVILFAFYLFGLLVANTAGLPVPGAIFGLLALIVLLALRKGRLPRVRAAAQLLLPLIPLFLIPVCVSMVITVPLHRLDSWKLIGLVGLSTVIGVVLTSAVTKWLLCDRPGES